MSSELHKPSGREGTGTFHSTKFVPKVAQSLTGNHISVHTLKLEQYIKMLYPLNGTNVCESAHLYPRNISTVYCTRISSAEVLNLGIHGCPRSPWIDRGSINVDGEKIRISVFIITF